MNSELDKVRQYYDGDDEENRFCDPRKKIEYINTCNVQAFEAWLKDRESDPQKHSKRK